MNAFITYDYLVLKCIKIRQSQNMCTHIIFALFLVMYTLNRPSFGSHRNGLESFPSLG